jgi:hypothetical protein
MLTRKQEIFACAIADGADQAAAYRASYEAARMSAPATSGPRPVSWSDTLRLPEGSAS